MAKKRDRREYNKKYSREHHKQIAERQKRWCNTHKKEITEKRKKYDQIHRKENLEYLRKYRSRPEAKAEREEYHLQSNYGLSLIDYDVLSEKQNNVCAICGGVNEGRRLCIDHQHKTNKIRGLLCIKCNAGLGDFMDSKELLLRAAIYLEEQCDE